MPLTRTFCAESKIQGVTFCHTYDAPDPETAEKIAKGNGWQFLGELVDEQEVEDEIVASIEKALTNPVVH